MDDSSVSKYVRYNPDTGDFTWLVDRGKARKGDIAKNTATTGYIVIGASQTKAHRLAFYFMEGRFPPDQVDHINRVRNDNRWCNLRHSNNQLNNQNRVDNVAFIGVNWQYRDNLWKVRSPRVNGKVKHIGSFKTHLAACYARHCYDLKLRQER